MSDVHITTTAPQVEIWKPVVGFEDSYSVSSFGQIRRERRENNTSVGRIIKPVNDQHGYMVVTINGGEKSKRFSRFVHRLVAEAFIGPRPHGSQVNHKDGNKTNNQIGNLEYCTCADNIHHSIDVLGKHRRGEKNGQANLTEDTVRKVLAAHAQGMSQRQIRKKFCVPRCQVYKIVTRRSWAHVEIDHASN